MSDRFHGTVKAGKTSVSIPVLLSKTADGTEQTGTVAAGVTASYWRQGGVRSPFPTLSDLGAVNAAFTAGGWKEVDATNQPGIFRLDVPDAAFTAGADWVVVTVKVASCYVYNERFNLESAGSAEVMGVLPAAGTAVNTAGGLITFGTGTGQLNPSAGGVDVQTLKTQAVTAAAGVTFPASIASPTNITAGTIANLTNLPAAPADWLSAAAVSTAAVTKIQTGLFLASAYTAPDNADVVTALADIVAVQSSVGSGLGAAVTAVYNRIGAAGAGLTALGDTRLAHLDADVSSRSAFAGLGSTAPAGWLNTAAFAAGATLPRVTLCDTVTAATVANAEFLTGTVVSATTTSVTFSPGPGTVFNATANAYAGTAPARCLVFTSGANKGLAATVTSSSVSGGNLTVGFAAAPGVVAATAGDTVQVD